MRGKKLEGRNEQSEFISKQKEAGCMRNNKSKYKVGSKKSKVIKEVGNKTLEKDDRRSWKKK